MSARNPQKWLRRLHAWLGAAVLGLCLFFAITGFALNHRAVLKIPLFDKGEVTVVMPLADPPAAPEALVERLSGQFGFAPQHMQVKREAARNVEWAGRRVGQPEQWIVTANQPSKTLRAEYWVGNGQAEIRLGRPNLWLHLARLHMATGPSAAWVVLADALVAGLLFLAFSGLWMWGRLHGSRRLLAGLGGTGVALALAIGWMAS